MNEQAETSAPAERSVVGMSGTPGQGPHIVFLLRVSDGRIAEATYSTYPCPAAHSCGRYVADRVEGMTTEEASAIDAAAIVGGVGNMPLGREHCPHLAADALANAIAEYHKPS